MLLFSVFDYGYFVIPFWFTSRYFIDTCNTFFFFIYCQKNNLIPIMSIVDNFFVLFCILIKWMNLVDFILTENVNFGIMRLLIFINSWDMFQNFNRSSSILLSSLIPYGFLNQLCCFNKNVALMVNSFSIDSQPYFFLFFVTKHNQKSCSIGFNQIIKNKLPDFIIYCSHQQYIYFIWVIKKQQQQQNIIIIFNYFVYYYRLHYSIYSLL